MPRKGKGTQPIADIPSPGYGQGEELAQMQRDVPLPQAREMDGVIPFPEPPRANPMELARDYVNPTGLPPTAPTTRPQVPVTNGLRSRQPVPPRRRNPAADTLEMLAELTGERSLVDRARRARGGR